MGSQQDCIKALESQSRVKILVFAFSVKLKLTEMGFKNPNLLYVEEYSGFSFLVSFLAE